MLKVPNYFAAKHYKEIYIFPMYLKAISTSNTRTSF